MEHQEAIKTYAAEGYLLGELTDAERDAFEQHFADCQSCFADVRDGARFIHALPAAATDEKHHAHVYRWPEMAAAAGFAVFVTAGIGHFAIIAPMRMQLTKTRAEVAQLREPQPAPLYRLTEGRNARLTIDGKLPAVLEFAILPERPSPAYAYAVVDARGKKWLSAPVTAAQAAQPIDISMVGGALPTGDYSLIVTGTGGVPVSTIEFTVR